MAGFGVRQVENALEGKLGFEKTGTHHHVYRLWLDGKLAARTYISHAERELRDFHVSHMARQMHLQVAEFADAVNCPLNRDEYYRILRQRAGS